MAAELVEGLTGHVDWQQQAKIHLAAARAGFENTMNNPLIDDERIFHVRYGDFVSDPISVIDRFYHFCGLSLSTEAEQAMRQYLKNNRGDRYGKFIYSTDMIGVDIPSLHEEFSDYRQRFGIDIEQRR